MKLWAMPCGATLDGQVMVESSDKTWCTGEGSGKPLQYSCLENPMDSVKRQKDRTLKDELPRSVGAQYATGDQWRGSRKNEETELSFRDVNVWKSRPEKGEGIFGWRKPREGGQDSSWLVWAYTEQKGLIGVNHAWGLAGKIDRWSGVKVCVVFKGQWNSDTLMR